MDTQRPDGRARFAIFGSGRGSNAAALMAQFRKGSLDADLALVLSNVVDAPILNKARAHGYPAVLVENQGRSREDHEALCLACLREHHIDHLLLAGYMRILSPRFIERFKEQCGGVILNIHPSLLPDFPGLSAVAAQWQSGARVAGATVHFVDAGVDTGPCLLSGSIDVRGDEGAEGLAARILEEVEHVIYPRAVRLLLDRLRRGAALHGPQSRTQTSEVGTA